MRWIRNYQLYLFDFDGLLVNTEEIHYQAYIRMCANRGFHLDWTFARFCSIAHYSSEGLRQQIYAQHPDLHTLEPCWDVLYAEKKQAFMDLIKEGAVHLMPGAHRLLETLAQENIKRCVVTNSAKELVDAIRGKIPILNTVSHWFTRESYSHPKPHPECYLHAIHMLAEDGEKVIGFEDSPRGLEALLGTRAQPVLISQSGYPEIPEFLKRGAKYYPSFESIFTDSLSK